MNLKRIVVSHAADLQEQSERNPLFHLGPHTLRDRLGEHHLNPLRAARCYFPEP
ncbi:hypothetical protein [Streptomyces sp. NPDC018693]|uniref:hypothetical protein n=1 Tax=unclassified Streptomyces TaxID=2593676 RepID=UPI0037AD0109